MREYVLAQAEAFERAHIFPQLRRKLRNWRARRGLAGLAQLDDHVLSDIGLRRADIEYLRSQPLDVDPVRELGRLATLNRRGALHGARA